MTLHIRGCWLANGSKRSEREQFRFITRAQAQHMMNQLYRELLDSPFLSKREARLIQHSQFRQNGGTP